MNYGGIVPARGARAAGPGLTDPAQAFGAKHRLELRQDNTMWVSESQKKKKQRKKNTGNSLCPSYGRAFLENQQQGKGCCPPRQGPQGAGGSHKQYFEIFSAWCDAG